MPVLYRSATTSVLQVWRSVGLESPRTITTCRNALTAPAQGAPDQGGPGRERTQTGRAAPEKEPPRQKIRGGSSSPPNSHRPLLHSGPEAHQLWRGRAGEQHPRSASLDGGDPSDNSKEARASPHHGQQGPGGGSGQADQAVLGAAQLPVRAAGSDGCRLRLHRHSSATHPRSGPRAHRFFTSAPAHGGGPPASFTKENLM
ncbi:hypothetical protein NDU88_001608 [Pleurodeles waltl]|uniref:Uncharacterized protein n=1 Tax=Pleurodeles waltl TaxID=8319 RepID=A0AAV7LA17_PLEWA|nr:hypothetical protein NDU88_001608 [Pleurodeles waltl]